MVRLELICHGPQVIEQGSLHVVLLKVPKLLVVLVEGLKLFERIVTTFKGLITFALRIDVLVGGDSLAST